MGLQFQRDYTILPQLDDGYRALKEATKNLSGHQLEMYLAPYKIVPSVRSQAIGPEDEEVDAVEIHPQLNLFHQAVIDGNLPLVKAFIARRAPLDEPDSAGLPALAHAVLNAQAHLGNRVYPAIAKALLEAGANPYPPLPSFLTDAKPFHVSYTYLYRSGDHQPVKINDNQRFDILEKTDLHPHFKLEKTWLATRAICADSKEMQHVFLSHVDDAGYTQLLEAAARSGSVSSVRRWELTSRLLEDPRSEKALPKLSPAALNFTLLEAAGHRDNTLAARVLHAGADPDYALHTDGYQGGYAPLHYAFKNENQPLIDMLVAHGASKNNSVPGFAPLAASLGSLTEPHRFHAWVKDGFRLHENSDPSGKTPMSDAEVMDRAISTDHQNWGGAGTWGLTGNQSVRDTLFEIYDRLIFPVLLDEVAKSKHRRQFTHSNDPVGMLYSPAMTDAIDALIGSRNVDATSRHPTEDRIALLLELHNTQNHTNIQYPVMGFDKDFSFLWHAMTAKEVTPPGIDPRYSVVCLTSSQELRDETKALGHCVGKFGYDLKCSQGKPDASKHMFSVRDRGKPISTFEVTLSRVSPEDAHVHDTRIEGTDRSLEIVQHRGLYDKTPPPEARRVMDAWLKTMASGKIAVSDHVGQETKNAKAYHKALQDYLKDKPYSEKFYEACIARGLHPVPMPDAEAAFDDAMRDVRRASSRYARDGQVIYTDKDPSHEGGVEHLIQGCYLQPQPDGGEKAISYRDMSLREWLRATGLMESAIRDVIRRKMPKIAQDLQAGWDAEDKTPIVGEKAQERQQLYRHEMAPRWQRHLFQERHAVLQAEDRREAHGSFVAAPGGAGRG